MEDPYGDADPEEEIEYCTVREFLRMVPFRINTEQVKQFGREVGYSADALQLSYVAKLDSDYGVTRAFSVKLLVKVYKVMALKLGWPKFVSQSDALEDETRMHEELAANRRAEKVLEALTIRMDDTESLQALETLRARLREESLRLRQAVEPAPAQ